jgi:hypothetical protein
MEETQRRYGRMASGGLKYHQGLICPTLLGPAGGRPAAVFYPLGHPTPYAYGGKCSYRQKNKSKNCADKRK